MSETRTVVDEEEEQMQRRQLRLALDVARTWERTSTVIVTMAHRGGERTGACAGMHIDTAGFAEDRDYQMAMRRMKNPKMTAEQDAEMEREMSDPRRVLAGLVARALIEKFRLNKP